MRPYNLYRLTRQLETKESALKFLRSQGTLPKQAKCDKCQCETSKTGIITLSSLLMKVE